MNSNRTGAGVSPSDRAVIAGELGRKPRGLTGVAVRCPFGHPAITESAPVFSEGEPNPTLLYVTCPALDAVIGRVEGAGGVRDMRASCSEDARLRELLDEVTHAYRERRTELLQGSDATLPRDPRLGAGIGGPEGPENASCLHAYAAALQAVITGWLVLDDPKAVEKAQEAWSRFLPPVEECWCADRRCAKWSIGEKRAVIDLGTISVRLLIADVVDGRPWPLVREATVTRLGQGLAPGGRLDSLAMERTTEAVEMFVDDARAQGVERIVLAGTSATREAADGSDFVSKLAKRYDLKGEVLSGEREAELAYLGASLDVSDPMVLDVGGGSTELVARSGADGVVAQSLKLGASRATEKWVKSDPPTEKELGKVAKEASREFTKLRDRFGAESVGSGVRRLVGVAGTVTTLAALSLGLEQYDSRAIHMQTLTLDQVRGVLDRLAGLTTEERAELPCVQAGRAPVIVAGAAIVAAAMDALGYQELTVSERDLLDGLAIRG